MENIEVPFRLPVVGLPMLKAERLLSKNSMNLNPFVIPKNTELMLINNERQRIQEQMTREKIKNVFKFHEKEPLILETEKELQERLIQFYL